MSHPFHHLDLQPVVWPEQVTADTPTLMVDYRWGFASDKEKAQCAKAWVRALPQFTHLRSLYFYSTCTPPLLEAITARVRRGDAVLVVDLQRHERWIVDAARRASAAGGRRIVVADAPLSALAAGAPHVFTVAAEASRNIG